MPPIGLLFGKVDFARRDEFAKRGADDYGDGQINDISASNEILEMPLAWVSSWS
jgi:hypothetical protein